MGCIADTLLVECVQYSHRLGLVRLPYSHALHFGAYLERICPGSKSTHILFQSTYPLIINVLVVTTQSGESSGVWVQSVQ
jgi:hypothetical protein